MSGAPGCGTLAAYESAAGAPPPKKAAYERARAAAAGRAGHDGHRHYAPAAAADAHSYFGGLRRDLSTAPPPIHHQYPFSSHAHVQTVETGAGAASGDGGVGRLLLGSNAAAAPAPFGPMEGVLDAAQQALFAAAAAASSHASSAQSCYPGGSAGSISNLTGRSMPSHYSHHFDTASSSLNTKAPPPSPSPSPSSSSFLSAALSGTGTNSATAAGAMAKVGATLAGRQVGLHPSYILAFVSHLSAGRVHLDRTRAVL
jgi:hypothetical protein